VGERRQAVLFDFFGTLVHYQPDRRELTYAVSHSRAVDLGYRGDHAAFVVDWDDASAELEAATATDHAEFSMTDAAHAFGRRAGLAFTDDDARELGSLFVTEWQRDVHPVADLAMFIEGLYDRFLLGIVSNTHDPAMVPTLLTEYGIVDRFDAIVLSVDHGFRKPHASIYRRALDAIRLPASEVTFVGDTLEPDYLAPRHAGMSAYLIGAPNTVVPEHRRLDSVLDLAERLGRGD